MLALCSQFPFCCGFGLWCSAVYVAVVGWIPQLIGTVCVNADKFRLFKQNYLEIVFF